MRLLFLLLLSVQIYQAQSQCSSFYIPVLNLNSTRINGQNQQAIPLTMEYTNLGEDNVYSHMNGDAVLQFAFNFYTSNFSSNYSGGIIHGRIGYAFFHRNKNAKSGIGIDLPVLRVGGVGGLGLTYFSAIQTGNHFILFPQVSFGGFVANESGSYISAEMDMIHRTWKRVGLSIRPYIFQQYNSDTKNRTLFGLKIGFGLFGEKAKTEKTVPEKVN